MRHLYRGILWAILLWGMALGPLTASLPASGNGLLREGIPASFHAEPCYAAAGYDQVAKGADTAEQKAVSQYGMVSIRGTDVKDGIYDIQVRSSSKFFRVEEASLTVKKGRMTAALTMYSSSYKYVYLGTAKEAAAAPVEEYLALKDRGGQGSFEMPVSGLNEEIACAAFSKKKKMWYDRTILFDASSLPEGALKIDLPDYEKIQKALQAYEQAADGHGAGRAAGTGEAAGSTGINDVKDPGASGPASPYEPVAVDLADGTYSIQVDLTGGSGRARVTSPTWLVVKGGKAYARLLWSSPYYDYMIAGGRTYRNETDDGGNSTFTIPIGGFDEPMPVVADTTAMGDPVEIAYELTFYEESIGSKNQVPQEATIRVLILALAIIAAGGILNGILKRRRKQ